MRKSRAVLHIGGHVGQESNFYNSLNIPVLWIEANPNHFNILFQKISNFPKQTAINALITSRCSSERQFFLSSNDGESSSIFPLSENNSWNLQNSGVIVLPSKSLDCVLRNESRSSYDYWILDVQGGELEVLQGSQESLHTCHYLQIEVSQEEYYVSGAKFEEVREWLLKQSFCPLWNPTQSHEEVIFVNTAYKTR